MPPVPPAHADASAEKRVLLEKSPPNIILADFLNTMWHLGSAATAQHDVYFVLTSRHPLAVAEAQRSWRDAEHLSRKQLIEHWLLQHDAVQRQRDSGEDVAPQLQLQLLQIKYEDLTADPAAVLASIYEFVGIVSTSTPARTSTSGGAGGGDHDRDTETAHAREAATAPRPGAAALAAATATVAAYHQPIRTGANDKYLRKFCSWLAGETPGVSRHAALTEWSQIKEQLSVRVQKHGYSLKEWPKQC